MSDNQNQNFDKLQRLLKLKRYEQPHPRYFNDLSSQVTARLRAGETARLDTFEEAMTQAPWLQRVWAIIERRPAFSGTLVAGLCGLLLVGGFLAGNQNLQPGVAANGEKKNIGGQSGEEKSLLATSTTPGTTTFASSTNPVTVSPGSGSLFSMPLGPNLQPQPVSLRPNSP